MIDSKIKYFTRKELQDLFRVAEKDSSKYAIRNQAILKIGYYCALRVSEISVLKLDDFNEYNNELYCRRLKGSKNNTLRIIDIDILRAFKRHLRKRNVDSEYIFISRLGSPISRKTIDLIIKRYCELANIQDKSKHHFHSLKHTRAIDLAEVGCDLKDIQYWLGHKEITNTQIYFQYTSRQQENLYNKLRK